MPLDEALAIVRFLEHVPPGKRDEAIFQEAWKVVCKHAMEAIDRIKFPALAGTR